MALIKIQQSFRASPWCAIIAASMAAGLAPASGVAQLSFDAALELAVQRQERLVTQIEAEQTRNGNTSVDLIEPLTALGLSYQEDEAYALSTAAIERARQVVSVNYGLYSMQQANFIRLMILNEERLGNFEAAWELEQELLHLLSRHKNDVATVPILQEIADKRMIALAQYMDGGLPPSIILGCYYYVPGNRSCTSGSQEIVVKAVTNEVQKYRATAIEALIANEQYDSPTLRELELDSLNVRVVRRLGVCWPRTRTPCAPPLMSPCAPLSLQELLNLELLRNCLDPMVDGTPEPEFNLGGLASRVRLYDYEIRSDAPIGDQVNAIVRIADWQLRIAHSNLIRGLDIRREYFEKTAEIYDYAHQQLLQNDVPEEVIENIFFPGTPVVLPDSTPNPLVSVTSEDSVGYIDIEFDIEKNGRAENIEILNATTNVKRGDRRDLVRLIEFATFRPRLTDGQFADSSPVAVRFYVDGSSAREASL